MPMPESSIVKVELVLSGMILMKKLGWASKGWTLKKKHFALEKNPEDPGKNYFAIKKIIPQSKRERNFHLGPWKKLIAQDAKMRPWHVFLSQWPSRCLDRSLWKSLWPSLCLAVPTLEVSIGISLGLTVSCKLASVSCPWHVFPSWRRSRCLDRNLWRSLWPSLCFAVLALGVSIEISLGLTVSCKVAKCCL